MITKLDRPVDWRDESHGRAWWRVSCDLGVGNVRQVTIFGTREDADREFIVMLLY